MSQQEWKKDLSGIGQGLLRHHPEAYRWRQNRPTLAPMNLSQDTTSTAGKERLTKTQGPVTLEDEIKATTDKTAQEQETLTTLNPDHLFPCRPHLVLDKPLHGYQVEEEHMESSDDNKSIEWTQKELDKELFGAAHKKRSNLQGKPGLKKWPDSLKRALCAQVSLELIRQRMRRTEPHPAATPKIKKWRATRPSPEVEHRWRHMPQNAEEWYKVRGESSGASSLYVLLGWSEAKTSNCQWLEDTGQAAEDERSVEKCFPLDEGHYREDESRRISALLLGCTIRPTGLWLHPRIPQAHASPDGLEEYPDHLEELIHLAILKDSLCGLWENKCTMFRALMNRGGAGVYGFPHWARPSHAIQVQAQMACLKADWCDYSNYWHFHEQAGIRPMFDGPFSYASLDEGKTFYNVERASPEEKQKQAMSMDTSAEGETKKTPGCWMVAELLISRFYASPEFQKVIYEAFDQHRKDVAKALKPDAPVGPQECFPWLELVRGIPPKRVNQAESPLFRWLPLVHAVFYLTGSPAELQHVPEIFEPDVLTRYMKATGPRPTGWVGEYPPRLDVAIQTFEHQEAQTVNLSYLAGI